MKRLLLLLLAIIFLSSFGLYCGGGEAQAEDGFVCSDRVSATGIAADITDARAEAKAQCVISVVQCKIGEEKWAQHEQTLTNAFVGDPPYQKAREYIIESDNLGVTDTEDGGKSASVSALIDIQLIEQTLNDLGIPILH